MKNQKKSKDKRPSRMPLEIIIITPTKANTRVKKSK